MRKTTVIIPIAAALAAALSYAPPAWNPTIAVTVPANTLAGSYSSAITHSVA